MHQRIDQLIEECTEYWTDKGDTYFDKEKFARLIVKECITLGTNFTNRNYSDDAGERIANHFGVEE